MVQMLNGRYTLAESIGQGGMGMIYRGQDQFTGLPVAIKQIKADIAADPLFANQFEREKQALQQLNHPRITQFIEAIETDDGDKYLVMEYVPGHSLAGLLEKELLPIEQALEIALDLADALQSAHQLKIIHGDIKPDNVLLAADNTPRLMDFGAAQLSQATQLMQNSANLGTFAYMSPEACRDEPLDTRTDIWSFGVMLYEMLAGQRPFDHPNLSHLTLAIMTEPPPDLQDLRPEISDRLADLVYRMLTKDRNWRIPKMSFIITELDAILYGSETIDTGFLAREVALGEEKSHNLPFLTTPLIGREKELAELERLLLDPAFRLITLHGPGGIGKTSLALQAAHNYHNQTQSNVYFVDLSNIENPNQIVTAIADAMQFNFFSSLDPQLQLINYLQNKEMLLLLDNFEQVTEGAGLLTEILFQSLGTRLLVTSQDRLNLLEELRVPVLGLPVPKEATYGGLLMAPAVQLFLQSVRHVQPAFVPTESDIKAIHRVCQLVDGLPLGIKLAATSMNVMTPSEIARQILVGTNVLTAGLPDLPARHRSLRSVFEYSWILLNEEEKRDLRYLSVFRGGFERDAARQYGITLPTLNALTDKSLLRRSPETGRFNLPAMFRRFAADKLAERPSEQIAAYQSHSNYYLQFLQSRESHLLGERQQMALREIDVEMGNIQAAWQWATNKRDRQGIGLGLEALYHFYQLRGRQQEGAEIFSKTGKALGNQADIVLAKILVRLGACYRVLGQLDEARQQLQQGLHLARTLANKREIAFALCQLSIAQVADPTTRTLLEESLALAEEIENQPLIAESLNWLAFTHYQAGDLETAVQLLEKSLAIGRELNATHGLAVSLTNLGIIYGHRGQDDQAQQVLKEALQNYKQLNDLHGMAAACNNLCYIAINAQNYRAARIWAEQALANQREVGDKRGIGEALGHLSEIAFYQADYYSSRKICQEGIALYQEMGLTTSPFFNILGRIALAKDDYKIARKAFQKALDETPVAALALNILTGFASVMVHDGLLAAAATLLHFIEQHVTSEPLVKERALTELAEIRQQLKPEQYQVAQAQYQKYSLAEWIEFAKSNTP
jgi:serine/threonine protein kinase/tetratricopeptide (TPR) repeat protein